ncbi:MAG: heat-inducible transcriptional repressor HrcA [Elusimicrobiota bacterium]
MELLDRKQKILQIVVQQYIRTGKPVGSRHISDSFELGCSPATVRNKLAELEDDGYLTHPHTSAGRVPTDIGYRYYVDMLLEIQRLTSKEQRRIEDEFSIRIGELQDVMMQTSKLLAMVSNYAGFVVSSHINKTIVSHLELIRLDQRSVLMVIVTKDGLVKHKVVQPDVSLTDAQIRNLSQMLANATRGKTFSEAINILHQELKNEKIRQESFVKIAKIISDQIFEISNEDIIFLDGAANIIEQEHEDMNSLKAVYKVIEQKEMLSHILSKQVSNEGIKVCIGKESSCEEMKNCSFVTSAYKTDDNTIGVLGIIGPKRMEYSRMIALVDYIAQALNKNIKKIKE